MSIPTLSDLNQTTLTPIVRAALESSSADVVDWQVSQILQGSSSPAAVYRVTGTAEEQGQTVSWSLFVKACDSSELAVNRGSKPNNDVASHLYWKRELLIYQSGLFDHLPDGFATPRCYHIDEQPGEGCIWMENVREDVGAIWPLEQYGIAARHLGRFNGVFLTGEPLPTWPWLMKEVNRQRLQRNSWLDFWSNYPTLRLENALVQRGWTDELAYGLNRIWEEREHFLQTLAQLPQTLNHFDAGRRNMFARKQATGEFETVVVDWENIGCGAVGEELCGFVTQPVYWFSGVRPDQLLELDKIAFDGYLQGLRDVGWQGDVALARLGYTISVALRAGIGVPNIEGRAGDEGVRTGYESMIGHPLEEIVDALRSVRRYAVACAEEARQLMASPIGTRLA